MISSIAFKQCLLFTALCVFQPYYLAHGPRAKPQKYAKAVLFGFTQIQTNDGCVTLGATMSAGDFFSNLLKIQAGNTVEFRKGSDVMTTFPGEIIITLHGWDNRTDTNCKGKSVLMTSGDVTLMDSLQFKAFWQRDSEKRDVAKLSINRATNSMTDWVYTFWIRSGSVPLTDHLVVWVLDSNGHRVATFTSAL